MSKTDLTCTMRRTKLIRILRDQRKAHVKEYQKAMTKWREVMYKEARKVIDTSLDRLNAFPTGLARARVLPASYVTEIDEVISLLENSTDSQVTLSQEEHKRLVMGQWDWKSNFDILNNTYANWASTEE